MKKRRDDDAFEIDLVRPQGRMWLALLLFGAASAYLFHIASTNTRGLLIEGLIPLDPGQADVFYFVLGLLGSAMTALAALSGYVLATAKRFRLRIGDEIRLPGTPVWKLRGEVGVPAAEVVGVEMAPPQKPRVVTIVTTSGRFGLPTAWLPEGVSPAEVAEKILARARAARGV